MNLIISPSFTEYLITSAAPRFYDAAPCFMLMSNDNAAPQRRPKNPDRMVPILLLALFGRYVKPRNVIITR
jgi:hypothetical protein